jgi:hypothetical protein
VLANLESVEFDEVGRVRLAEKGDSPRPHPGQLHLFASTGPSPVEEEIRALDIHGLTPLEALTLLSRLQGKLKK